MQEILARIYYETNEDVIVISKLLKRHSKAKRKAPAYSRALHLVRGVVQKSGPRRSESGFQWIREGTADVKVDVF